LKNLTYGTLLVAIVRLCSIPPQVNAQTTEGRPANPLANEAAMGEDSVEFGKIPFEGMDLTWINGQNRQRTFPLANGIVTGSVYLDTYYNYNFAQPIDNTHTISSSIGRHNEFTVNLASIGLETNYKNIIGRVFLQTGAMLNIVQELDGTLAKGRNLAANGPSSNNLKFVREAAAGYHFNKWYGINVEMGIFMSYIGLESYILGENWNYQRSMVCDFTPFYFSGARVQAFPTRNFKTELWLMNGWQSYGKWNKAPGIGSSNYFRPNENLQLVANFYYGYDSQLIPDRIRAHSDYSAIYRYYKGRATGINQAAVSVNAHYGFQSGGRVADATGTGTVALPGPDDAYMTGVSVANRTWFAKKKAALSLRGDVITNPSRYLAFSPGNFGSDVLANSGAGTGVERYLTSDQIRMYQGTATVDIMPNDFFTFRIEYAHRWASVPYLAGKGGTTSTSGYQGGVESDFIPDIKERENRITIAAGFRL
jgi:hypothetical protein